MNAEKRDLKKHFEAILGRKIESDLDDGEIALRDDIGISIVQEGSVTSREIGTTGDSTKTCRVEKILDASGIARTGTDGTVRFPLSDFLCEYYGYGYPVNFVATPQSRSPVYLTSTQTLTSNRKDVTITVYAWDKTGTPAPNVSFDWRCRIPIPVTQLPVTFEQG